MKKLSILILFLTTINSMVSAQNLILNGSFENNAASGNVSDLTSNWQLYVLDSWEVDGGAMDLIEGDDCGTAPVGHWFVRTSPQPGSWPYLAFSLKLSGPLVPGTLYNLSLDKKFCGPNSSAIDIGLSDDSTLMGTLVHTFDAPLINSWLNDSYAFTAASASKYLTVNVGVNGSTGQIALDDFVLQVATGIGNSSLQQVAVFPNPFSKEIMIQAIPVAAEIEIDNLLGTSVYHGVSDGGDESLALNFLSSGVYILMIREAGSEKVIKLIKE